MKGGLNFASANARFSPYGKGGGGKDAGKGGGGFFAGGPKSGRNYKMKDFVIRVNMSGRIPGAKGPAWGAQEDGRGLHISGLASDATDRDLYEIFSQFGALAANGIKTMIDKETGNCKGTAMVHFVDKETAELAQKTLNGMPTPDGFMLNIRIMQPLEVKEAPKEGVFASHAAKADGPAPPEQAGDAASAPAFSGTFIAGQRVQVEGLKSKAELNGQEGVCKKFNVETGRWTVNLDSGGEIACKEANLKSKEGGVKEEQMPPEKKEDVPEAPQQKHGIFAVGQRIQVRGLIAKASLNGQEGSLKQFNSDTGRWTVKFDNGEELSVKDTNLIPGVG